MLVIGDEMEKIIYTPTVFDINNIDDAKKIILTNEGEGLGTNERWRDETTYLSKSIRKKLKLNENSIVLDFGCGIGRLAKELIAKTNCRVIGVDISLSMRNLAVEYVNSRNFEAISPEDLVFRINRGFRFDCAYSIWVLQHCVNPKSEIDLIQSSLKKDALFYVLNNKVTAIPTNRGWVSNGIDILGLLQSKFEEIKNKEAPKKVFGKKGSDAIFISVLKNLHL